MVSAWWICTCVLIALLGCSDAHGNIKEPAGRTSAYVTAKKNANGLNIPADFNANALFCGGKYVLWDPTGNNGRCGVCGDNWAQPEPRDHEEGGKFVGATTVIVKNYSPGLVIDITVTVTANHLGYFEFRLCERNSISTKLTHACLNKHLLQHPTSGSTKFAAGNKPGNVVHQVQLPPGVQCQFCVLQWKYVTGNDWGICPDGTGSLGCSPTPEQFYACADIRISPNGPDTGATTITDSTYNGPVSGSNSGGGGGGGSGGGGGGGGGSGPAIDGSPGDCTSGVKCNSECKGVGNSEGILDKWCCDNCNKNPPVCPETHCTRQCLEGRPTTSCGSGCRGVAPWDDEQTANWCCSNCNHNPPNCPPTHCTPACGLAGGLIDKGVKGASSGIPSCPSTCTGVGEYNTDKMLVWCCINCNHSPSNCPASHCSQACIADPSLSTGAWNAGDGAVADGAGADTADDNKVVPPPNAGACHDDCRAIGSNDPAMTTWCCQNCRHNPPNCPAICTRSCLLKT